MCYRYRSSREQITSCYGSIPNLSQEPYSNVFFITGSSPIYKLHKHLVFMFRTSPLTLHLSISFSMKLLLIKFVCKERNNLLGTVPSNTRLLLSEASNGHLSGMGLYVIELNMEENCEVSS